ncbi:MAG: membrane protein insertion efficiency factor YidD [Pirellula sp.]|nr:membrane protein insertion efficiency factor YidD [Pirellula sp.]
MSTIWQRVIAVPSWLLIAAVRCYQLGISPFIGPRCRFQPTCSQYFIEAVRKYGALRGTWKGLCRIGRCHPWGGSGYDPP